MTKRLYTAITWDKEANSDTLTRPVGPTSRHRNLLPTAATKALHGPRLAVVMWGHRHQRVGALSKRLADDRADTWADDAAAYESHRSGK